MPKKSRWIHCVECGRNQLHHSKGLCAACYQYQYRKTHHNQRQEYMRWWHKCHNIERLEYHRQYHAQHEKELAEYLHKWREEHKEVCREYSRKWCRANPDKNREKSRQWRKANPDKRREQYRRYCARKNSVVSKPVNEQAVYRRDGCMCIYCGMTKNLTLDHIVALVNGGSHCEENLVVACKSCNSSKQDKPLEDWLLTQPKALTWVM